MFFYLIIFPKEILLGKKKNKIIFPKEILYFQSKCPRHIPFIVHYYLKISNIHLILIKLENSYVLDK